MEDPRRKLRGSCARRTFNCYKMGKGVKCRCRKCPRGSLRSCAPFKKRCYLIKGKKRCGYFAACTCRKLICGRGRFRCYSRNVCKKVGKKLVCKRKAFCSCIRCPKGTVKRCTKGKRICKKGKGCIFRHACRCTKSKKPAAKVCPLVRPFICTKSGKKVQCRCKTCPRNFRRFCGKFIRRCLLKGGKRVCKLFGKCACQKLNCGKSHHPCFTIKRCVKRGKKYFCKSSKHCICRRCPKGYRRSCLNAPFKCKKLRRNRVCFKRAKCQCKKLRG